MRAIPSCHVPGRHVPRVGCHVPRISFREGLSRQGKVVSSAQLTAVFSPALAKAKLGCSRHCHLYVCVSGCPRSPFSPKLLNQILPKLTGGCSRTSRCVKSSRECVGKSTCWNRHGWVSRILEQPAGSLECSVHGA